MKHFKRLIKTIIILLFIILGIPAGFSDKDTNDVITETTYSTSFSSNIPNTLCDTMIAFHEANKIIEQLLEKNDIKGASVAISRE
ncbi:MAG: hypothetical protein ACOCUL_03920, partial [Bacteroidota bacterium]